MKISKIHQLFSDYLERPDALTNPEKYLGPNWEDVLNFWIYLDSLSEQEIKEMDNLYWALDRKVRVSASIASSDAASDVFGREFSSAAWYAARDVTGCGVFGYATDELIASRKLIEQDKPPTFLPLCVKS